MGVPAKVQPPARPKLSERDEYFLEILFTECKGDPRKAQLKAGYPESMPSTKITRRLKLEILDELQTYMAHHSPKAVSFYFDVLDGKYDGDPQLNQKLKAAGEILDRVGVTKTLKSQVKHEVSTSGAGILPPKVGEN